MSRFSPAALLLATILAGCRQPPSSPTSPGTPPAEPVHPPVQPETVVPRPAGPMAASMPTANPNAAALARAYLADHHLNWGTCVLTVPSYDGDVMMTFAPTGNAAADAHTLLVHPDGTVTTEQ